MKLDNTELQQAINGALKELKADGTLDAIKANYVGENAGKNPYKSPDNVSRDKGTLVMATNAEFLHTRVKRTIRSLVSTLI